MVRFFGPPCTYYIATAALIHFSHWRGYPSFPYSHFLSPSLFSPSLSLFSRRFASHFTPYKPKRRLLHGWSLRSALFSPTGSGRERPPNAFRCFKITASRIHVLRCCAFSLCSKNRSRFRYFCVYITHKQSNKR